MTTRSDAWRDSYDSWKLATPPEYEGEDAEPDDGTEPCPNCNVEWADQHLGDCDICNGKRRVRRYVCDAPSEAEINRSQSLIGAILGLDADDEIKF